MGQSQGTAMQGGDQGSLWQQSDWLDLVGAEPAAANPTRSSPTETVTPGNAEAEASPVVRPASGAAQHSTAPDLTGLPSDNPRSRAAAPDAPSPAAAAAVTPADSAQIPLSAPAPDTQPSSTGHPPATATHAAPRTEPREQRPGPASPSLPPLPAPTAQDPASLPACPERLLILDTETTALSPQQGQCIEVGAVLFDVASRSVLMQVSFLLPCAHNPAQAVNGIPAAVSRLEQPWPSGLACFEAMAASADALLAHNAAFDRQWFGNGELPLLEKPWICSMEDIRWPADRQLRATPSVRDLALAYGVPVWAAHRALTDCIYLVQVFQRCEELEPLLQAALEPRRLVRARLSYDERQLAKDAGFRWNEPVPKAWSRRLSEREIAALPFAVDPVEAEEPGRPRREATPGLWRRSA